MKLRSVVLWLKGSCTIGVVLGVVLFAFIGDDTKAATRQAPTPDHLLTPSTIGQLRIGTPRYQVERVFGRPVKEKNFFQCRISISLNPLRLSRYKRRNGTVTLRINRAQKLVDGYLTTSPAFMTARGIGVGDTAGQLFAAYGRTLRRLEKIPLPGGGVAPIIWILAKGSAEGMAFELKKGKVVSISAGVEKIEVHNGLVTTLGGGASPLCFKPVFLNSNPPPIGSEGGDYVLWNLFLISFVLSGAVLITVGAKRRSTGRLLVGFLLLGLGMAAVVFESIKCLDNETQSCDWLRSHEELWNLPLVAFGTTFLGALCARLHPGRFGKGGRYVAWISAWTVAIFVCYIVLGMWIEPETFT